MEPNDPNQFMNTYSNALMVNLIVHHTRCLLLRKPEALSLPAMHASGQLMRALSRPPAVSPILIPCFLRVCGHSWVKDALLSIHWKRTHT